MSLRGKVALITGSGRNSERAQELAREGASLALQYDSVGSKNEVLHLGNELVRAYPGIQVSIHTDSLSTSTAIEKLFQDVLTEHGHVDIVVNTAGMILKKPITNVSAAEYDKMFAYAVFVDEQRRCCAEQHRLESIRLQLHQS